MTDRPSTRDDALAVLTAPGAAFEISTEDVLGEAMPVFVHRHRSLGELIAASAGSSDREYLVTEHSRLTFAEHHDAVAALAAALRDEYRVGPGDRVAICSANNPEWILTFWATVSLGAVAVGLNSLWAGPELAAGLDTVSPVVLVADAPRRGLAGDPGIPVLSIEDDVPALVARHAGAPLPQVAVAEDDPAVILFTSGTTGRAKGATHSHRNVISALWFHLLNDAVAAALGNPQADRRYLLLTPLFHISALHNIAVPRLVIGDTAVIGAPRFDVDTVLRLIEAEQVTNWGAVPTMAARLVRRADEPGGLAGYDLSSLRSFTVNSAPSSVELKARLREVLPSAGAGIGTSYGLTESSTGAAMGGPGDLLADPLTVGRPAPTMAIQIRDAADQQVPEGTEGEVCLRGPQMMLGYWNDPAATAAAFGAGRWFHTGDLGTMVDGRLRISSRRSDLILRGGENVYPAEVEYALEAHPAVRECVVLGAPHADLGEEVCAVVVLDPAADVGEVALAAHVAERLARFKVPSRWTLSSQELPRNASGKVDRRLLAR